MFTPIAQIRLRLKNFVTNPVVYFTFSGVDKGGYRGKLASGKFGAYSGIDLFRVRGGKIVERWDILNTINMMHQIGAITVT